MMTSRTKALLSAALLLGSHLASPAHAQTSGPCANRDAIVASLMDNYGEQRQSVALGANNTLVETFASLETGTWTIVVTTPGGPTCLVASGQAFQLVEQDLALLDQQI